MSTCFLLQLGSYDHRDRGAMVGHEQVSPFPEVLVSLFLRHYQAANSPPFKKEPWIQFTDVYFQLFAQNTC